ncbi:MAG: hypothetical protein CME62_10025 [Halobacteriovoraceae bacterium]|nr:hypothetical protein [Halobacteriovoraceae bacterium]|tara:strand:- start:1118 stop:3679 length:2562 start_codon:yes stop_codon:yes gene_type:complete
MIAAKLARREIKNNGRYWMFFTANLCIGLMGFTFIYLFKSNVTNALEMRAKTLLSSDIALSGRRDLSQEEKQKLFAYMETVSTDSTQLREVYSMTKTQKKNKSISRLTFIKAVQKKYPLIGSVQLENYGVLDSELITKLQNKPWVIISPEVAHQFKIGVGDQLTIGEVNFKVFDTIQSDTTSSLRGLGLAPKVYIGDKYLTKTELLSFGSIAYYSYYFNIDKKYKADDVKNEIYQRVTDPALRVKTPENSSEQIGRVIGNLSNYLGLIGIVALLISCVGASYLFQSYLFDRLKQMGILKALGVGKRDQTLSFVLVISFFGFLATLLAMGFAYSLLPLAFHYLEQWMSFPITMSIDIQMVLTMLGIGVIINLLICTPLIRRVFKGTTIELINTHMTQSFRAKDALFYLPALLFIWGLSIWQSNSIFIGSIFIGGMVIIFLIVLLVLPFALNAISNYLKNLDINKPFNLYVAYGLRLVSRNKLSTLLTVLCLAIGVSLLSVIGQLDKSLKSELIGDGSPKPSLFLFDIQQEQYDELIAYAKSENIPLNDPVPMIRARLRKKNGEVVKRQLEEEGFTTNEEERRRRFNNRGVNLSYAKGLNPSEKLSEGVEFSGVYSGEGPAEISLEKRYAKRLGVDIGDTLTYEVLGVEITGEVVNLRSVKWTSFLPNFFITFQPGVLDDAPKTYLSAVSKVDFQRQLEIQDLIVEKFPNISMINVSEIIEKMMTLFAAMAMAIGVMSLCCISVGTFVLYSILQSQMHKKKNDFALQKIVGMQKNEIFKTLLSEYVILVLTALFLGTSIGFLLALGVSYFLLDGLFVVNYEFLIAFNMGLLIVSLGVVLIAFKQHYRKTVLELLN